MGRSLTNVRGQSSNHGPAALPQEVRDTQVTFWQMI